MSNTIIQNFDYEAHKVTVETDDSGQLWFRADEVCAVLEFSNARDALRKHVDENDVAKRDTIDNLGRRQQVNTINESGLYALILRSHKPKAQGFKRWVTSRVLPSIRQTGGYGTQERPEQMITVPMKHYIDLVERMAGKRPMRKERRADRPLTVAYTRVTDEEREAWMKDFGEGMTPTDIASKYNRALSTVSGALSLLRLERDRDNYRSRKLAGGQNG